MPVELAGLEIQWATTWCGRTDQLGKLVGLPHFASANTTQMDLGDKLRAAQAVLNSGKKLIWADDEAIPPSWDSNNDRLLIRPKPSRGLRMEDFAKIEDFVVG